MSPPVRLDLRVYELQAVKNSFITYVFYTVHWMVYFERYCMCTINEFVMSSVQVQQNILK